MNANFDLELHKKIEKSLTEIPDIDLDKETVYVDGDIIPQEIEDATLFKGTDKVRNLVEYMSEELQIKKMLEMGSDIGIFSKIQLMTYAVDNPAIKLNHVYKAEAIGMILQNLGRKYEGKTYLEILSEHFLPSLTHVDKDGKELPQLTKLDLINALIIAGNEELAHYAVETIQIPDKKKPELVENKPIDEDYLKKIKEQIAQLKQSESTTGSALSTLTSS